MTQFKDIADQDEDSRIQEIGQCVMRDKKTVGFVTDSEAGKADRYISKLTERFPGIRLIDRGDGPVKDTVSKMNRKFNIGDILSVYTGRLLSPSRPPIDGVYAILTFLHQDSIYTHQIPRACRDAKPWLEESLPWLRGITCEEVTPLNYRERLAHYVQTFGAEHELSPIPHAEELHRDAIQEAEEIAPGRVIVVERPDA